MEPAPTLAPQHRDLPDFKRRVGFPAAPDTAPDHIVAIDWTAFMPAVQAQLAGFTVEFEEDPAVLPAALPERTWMLQGAAGKVVITVAVASSADEARAYVVARAAETMMVTIPYERGPTDLGEFSVVSLQDPSQSVMWSHRNIFTSIDNDATGADVLPLARAIQRHLAAAPRVSAVQHLPVIASLTLSANEVPVGGQVEVSAVLGETTASRDAATAIGEVSFPRRLELVSTEERRVVLRATTPGTAQIVVRVMDPATLLSATKTATVTITPARDDAGT